MSTFEGNIFFSRFPNDPTPTSDDLILTCNATGVPRVTSVTLANLFANVSSLYATTITATNISATSISATTITATTISGTISADTVKATTISATNISGDGLSGTTVSGTTLVSPTVSATDVKATTITATTVSSDTVKATTVSGTVLSGTALSGTTLSGSQLLLADGTQAAPSLYLTDVGIYRSSAGTFDISISGNPIYRMSASWFQILSDNIAVTMGAAADLRLYRDAANTLAMKNGVAAPQTFNLYGTFGDATNYERAYITATPATSGVTIGASAAGSGAAAIDVIISPHGTGYVEFGTYAASASIAGAGYITIKDSAGNLRKLVVAT